MNSTTLQELKAQRMALDAQIQAAEDEIARSGESIVVDGQTFDKVADFEGTLPSPADTDYFPTYRKDSNGDIVSTGEITYAGLVATFAEEATTILNQAIAAGNTAVENISDAQSAALGAIGQDDSSGARGAALTSIGTAKEDALDAIGKTDSEGARKNALDAISAALTSALSSIGQSDTAGARGDAITAIATALANALASIGQTDNEGARKAALDAISTAKANALSAIGESDTTGARGDAIEAINALYSAISEAITSANDAWDAKVVADNSALDQKISSANQTIDAKVSEATEQAGIATTKASEASQSAQNASGSANTASQKASEASQSAQDAADSASAASTSEQNASASEEAASNSASAAATSESNAGASATTATEQAGIATTKAGEASTSASQAAESKTGADNAKTLAEKYANAPEDEVVEVKDGVNQYSAFHYSEKAKAAANSPLASESQAGRSRITSNPDYSRPSDNTDPVAASIEALQTVRNLFMGYKATIGDGSTLTFTVTHNLGTQDIMPMIGGDSVPEWELSTVDANSVSITFTEAPAASSITVLILPVRTASTGGGVI